MERKRSPEEIKKLAANILSRRKRNNPSAPRAHIENVPIPNNMPKLGTKEREDIDRKLKSKTEDSWDKISPQNMAINKLKTAQGHIHIGPESVERKLNEPEGRPIKVINYRGKKYIVDGHHTYYAAKAAGEEEIPVQVLDLDKNRFNIFGKK